MLDVERRVRALSRVWSARRWSAPGLLLASWCVLLASVILTRHVHASVLPLASPFEISHAYNIGTNDVQTITIGVVVAAVLAAVWGAARRSEALAPTVTPRAVRPGVLVATSAVGVCLLVFLMLFRALPAATDCPGSRIIEINTYLGFVWNCDSALFQDLASNPLGLLEEGNPRQNRPVYAMVGYVLVHTVGALVGWFGLGQWEGNDTRAFISLDVLNVLILIVAVVLIARLLLAMGTPIALTVALAIGLAFNHLTAEWTLTPHQQTFAMLVPVVTVLAARRALLDPPRWRTAGWWGLAIGLGALAYGSWIITVVVVALALLIRLRLGAVSRVVALLAGFAAPMLAWVGLCRIFAGSYYNHEVVAFRQFVWVLDSVTLGPTDLVRRSGSYLLLTVREILGTRELWIVAAVVSVGVVLAGIKGIDLRPSTPEDRGTLAAVWLTLATSVLFLWGIGFYTSRLSMVLFPPLLIVAGWVYSRLAGGSTIRMGRVLSVCAPVALVGWLAFVLA